MDGVDLHTPGRPFACSKHTPLARLAETRKSGASDAYLVRTTLVIDEAA